jgi:beta-glucosidase
VLEAWFPGEEGGVAVAEALCGEVNPGGKLPISFPRSAGQIPVFYAHKLSGGRSQPVGDYVDLSASPLYPFGHGLSYTTFELSGAHVREEAVDTGGEVVVDVVAANTGDRAGDEIVQLYVRDPRASVTRPVLELKSFARVELEPGESKTVTFRVPVAQLGFYDQELSYVVEPGVIEVFVGRSSDEVVEAGRVTVTEHPSEEPPAKAFDGSVSVG